MAWLNERRPVLAGDTLLPVVVQDADDGTVLMLAWANAQALEATEATGRAHFWSRSRNELWLKGATSGNYLHMVGMATDCDDDAILYRVRPAGPACHTNERSCFPDAAASTATFGIGSLARLIHARREADPATSYTARLLGAGARRAGEKVVEEAGELMGAALAGTDEEVRNEAADLLYHLLVVLEARHVSIDEVEQTLAARQR